MKRGIDYIGIAVGALIFNDRREILLCKRSQNVTNERGCWEAPGGGVEFGETLRQAILREMKEELGVDLELLEQLPAADHILPDEHQHWVPSAFVCRIKKGQKPKILEPDKCDEIYWFPLDHLPQPLSVITSIDINRYNQLHPIAK